MTTVVEQEPATEIPPDSLTQPLHVAVCSDCQARVLALPVDQRSELEAWADDATDHPDERERWMEPPLPAGLGKPHKVSAMSRSDAETGREWQVCEACGVELDNTDRADREILLYPATSLVGTDCSGKRKKKAEANHHYPKRGTKAKTRTTGE